MSHFKSWNIKNTMTYHVIGNLGPGMGQAHKCDRDNPVIYLFYSDKDDLLSISFFRLLLVRERPFNLKEGVMVFF